ncbi:MAG: hypothetical protein AAGD96_35470, partial [Chloroflexota bacterium]
MGLFELTEQSIIVLAQLILLLLGAMFLVRQRFTHVNGWLLIAMAIATLSYTLILFYHISLKSNSANTEVIPLVTLIPLAFGISAFIQFSYRFPILANQFKIERFLATSFSILVAIVITIVALLN